MTHAVKRSWHLLSHFWLILFGIFLPIAVVKGNYHIAFPEIIEEMFGLESELNWYSWYVYFYIYAMLIMPFASRFIDRFRLLGCLAAIVVIMAPNLLIHTFSDWEANIWLKAVFDCCLCSPTIFAGYYCARFSIFSRIKLIESPLAPAFYLAIATLAFCIRFLPHFYLYDFVITTVFIYTLTAVFESSNIYGKIFIALGR